MDFVSMFIHNKGFLTYLYQISLSRPLALFDFYESVKINLDLES